MRSGEDLRLKSWFLVPLLWAQDKRTNINININLYWRERGISIVSSDYYHLQIDRLHRNQLSLSILLTEIRG
jgi:hypothetical protein